MIRKLKDWARKLKKQIIVLYHSCKDSRMPWHLKFFAAAIVAYALSPIDLIPDFIPVLGFLDDVILLPLGIWAALKLIPPEVIRDARTKAEEGIGSTRKQSLAAAAIIILVWVGVLAGVFYWITLK